MGLGELVIAIDNVNKLPLVPEALFGNLFASPIDLVTCSAYPKKLMSTLGPSPTECAMIFTLKNALKTEKLSKCLLSSAFVVVMLLLS